LNIETSKRDVLVNKLSGFNDKSIRSCITFNMYNAYIW